MWKVETQASVHIVSLVTHTVSVFGARACLASLHVRQGQAILAASKKCRTFGLSPKVLKAERSTAPPGKGGWSKRERKAEKKRCSDWAQKLMLLTTDYRCWYHCLRIANMLEVPKAPKRPLLPTPSGLNLSEESEICSRMSHHRIPNSGV